MFKIDKTNIDDILGFPYYRNKDIQRLFKEEHFSGMSKRYFSLLRRIWW